MGSHGSAYPGGEESNALWWKVGDDWTASGQNTSSIKQTDGFYCIYSLNFLVHGRQEAFKILEKTVFSMCIIYKTH